MNLSTALSNNRPQQWLAIAALALGAATPSWAIPITKQLVVNVIQVCDNAGLNCASTGKPGDAYYEKEVDKIWAQAGIDVKFVPMGQLFSSALLNGSTGIDAITGGLPGPGTTMYLMNTIAGVYGNAWQDAGGLAISMADVDAFNGGIGRLDTIAHELGHNLGLFKGDPGGHDNSNPNFLMASGGIRNIPGSLADICPDGLCRDLLSAAHIADAFDSPLLIPFVDPGNVPEPHGLALAAVALFSISLVRRRRA
jgi:hypothetical protein